MVGIVDLQFKDPRMSGWMLAGVSRFWQKRLSSGSVFSSWHWGERLCENIKLHFSVGELILGLHFSFLLGSLCCAYYTFAAIRIEIERILFYNNFFNRKLLKISPSLFINLKDLFIKELLK